ncbi:MAG: SirB2 family protein [Pseudomonadota bacterium]|nr:SirB2 family protein [Pseudomonadota bacterium]
MYILLRHIHLTTVALSVGLFILRGYWMVRKPVRLEQRCVKIVPHVVDTILLVSAIGLLFQIGQYPFVNHWLTAKVLGLVVYIVLGTIALKRGKTLTVRLAAFAGALITVAYIIAVARAHNPLPW